MTNKLLFFFLTLWLIGCAGDGAREQAASEAGQGESISLGEGTLQLLPLAEGAVRVRYTVGNIEPLEELIYTEHVARPKYKVERSETETRLTTRKMQVKLDHATGQLTFSDAKGRVLLQESPAGRRARTTQVKGMKVLDVEQHFISPDDECLFGTGQFQDGYLNIRGLSRRLTQVNTQISIPFILSSKGYGLLWNNYGLTELNPKEETLVLMPSDETGEAYEVTATSTTGGIREQRIADTFSGRMEVAEAGDYALLLDVGRRMSRRQYLAIDGKVLTNQNNTWLPPTTSLIVPLEAGTHTVVVKGVRGDNPVISWGRVEAQTVLHSPVAQALDYTVFAGTPDEVVATYRKLTGPAPLMPDWMLGYVHCRERYHSQQELLENARMFREKDIPASVIVQDWQWWGRTGWNSMQFDPELFPQPKELVDELHKMNFRMMLSVWSKVDRNSMLGREFDKRNYYIHGTDWIDFFHPEAAQFYWANFRDSLVRRYGIDSWWLDATEPENDDLVGRRVAGGTLPGELVRNVYPVKVVSTVYNGLCEEMPGKVPVILTRSAFAGMQRYNAVTWSGDVGNDGETLRRQIVGGLGYMACGMPWWTYDAGGFFRPGNQYTDAAYQEMMLRWIECSVFLPIMRVHGYISNTEPWNYPVETEQIFTECIRQRTELLPYLRKCAKRVAKEGYTLMRPLVFDFADDVEALRQQTEYMFGPRYLVCPVTEAGATEWRVYLPHNPRGWDDLYTQVHYDGGQYITIPLTLDKIPVFVRK
ncbi:MAG: DUF4968 domain-containing protein [Bacteroidaceae bacterium]|nr:DUF4968 domain-containing protein [Bacteroidaceae bacterium]